MSASEDSGGIEKQKAESLKLKGPARVSRCAGAGTDYFLLITGGAVAPPYT